jgi:predicted DNA-binding protein
MAIKETKETSIKIRLTDTQKEKLDAYTEENGITKSDFIRQHIDSLPDPKNK